MKQGDLFGNTIIKGKPFLKWAGGKGQLITSINDVMPSTMSDITTYIEPFVGSGAIMFWVATQFPNIKRIIINDFNSDLVNTYLAIKEYVEDLIKELHTLDIEYKSKSEDGRKEMYYKIREEYNSRSFDYTTISVRMASLFIFLNRTCFNGLYRVNSKNLFNVPHGKYSNPKICDEDTLREDSEILQKVEILCGDFANTIEYADKHSLYYFDPPYKPISETSSFNSYSCDCFNDEQQIRLRDFCNKITTKGAKWILSNSDPKQVDGEMNFFDDIYREYNIKRVNAKRNINSKGNGRGEIKELLITNY